MLCSVAMGMKLSTIARIQLHAMGTSFVDDVRYPDFVFNCDVKLRNCNVCVCMNRQKFCVYLQQMTVRYTLNVCVFNTVMAKIRDKCKRTFQA